MVAAARSSRVARLLCAAWLTAAILVWALMHDWLRAPAGTWADRQLDAAKAELVDFFTVQRRDDAGEFVNW
jgi:hypothetical protein